MTAHEVELHSIRNFVKSANLPDALKAVDEILASNEAPTPELVIICGAVLAQFTERREAGVALIKSARDTEPDNGYWASDLGLGLILLGDNKAAIRRLDKAVETPEVDAVTYSRLGAALLASGDLEGAARAYEEANRREPSRAEWHYNLGTISIQRQKMEDALDHYDAAIRLKPDFDQAREMRHQVLTALDRSGDIAADLEAQVANDPESLFLRLKLARALDQDNRLPEALLQLREAIKEAKRKEEAAEDKPSGMPSGATPAAPNPRQVDLWMEVASMLMRRSRHLRALGALSKAEELDPDRVEILKGKATVLNELGRHEKALEVIERAIERKPEGPGLKVVRASIHAEKGDYETAEKALRELVAVYPGDVEVLSNLGHTLMWLGKIDEAGTYFERAAKINPGAMAALVESHGIADDDAAIAKMQGIAENKLGLVQPRTAVSYGLAKVFDKRKDYDKAFHYLDLGNRLAAKTVDFKPEAFTKMIDQYINVFTAELFERFKGVGNPSDRPIFVCGMPRSGTTLAEQILGSHPDIHAAGELPIVPQLARRVPRALKAKRAYPLCVPNFGPKLFARLGAGYLKQVMALDDEAKHVIDKLPHNFMQLGLIALILPNAKLIHLRRDPRDVAVSNYQQNFKAKHGLLGYSVDLEHTARHLNDHQRLMDHWHKVLPVPLFELDYEAMVEDQEGTTRALLDFVGLHWDDRVVDFHKTERAVRTASVLQVRQPIYKTSKQKWRNYEKHLDPLLDNLNPEVTAYFDG